MYYGDGTFKFADPLPFHFALKGVKLPEDTYVGISRLIIMCLRGKVGGQAAKA